MKSIAIDIIFWIFYAQFHIGYYKNTPKGHKWISTYNEYYDGDNTALWIWRFAIEVTH